MKLTILSFLISTLSLFAGESYSQNTRISLNMKNAQIKDVLLKIENSSEFFFIYNNQLVDVDRTVSINVNNEKIIDILADIFQDQHVEFQVDQRKIVIVPTTIIGQQATSKVSGKVTDSSGSPIPGASVVIKGTTNGTITNVDGDYSLSNIPAGSTLVVSFIGMKVQEISVGNKVVINVTLTEESIAIEEVVAVGYGVQKKSDVTGSMVRVSENTIKERPVQNALQAIQGKAAGVQISLNNRPGELGEIRIRGNRSINASNDPLYVIDGIPMAAGSMSDINPNDIESIEILKDASSTAIYGSRAANGVVLVTTKKGKAGKTSINYNGSVTLSNLNSQTDWMNAGEQIDWNRQSVINSSSYTGKYGNAPDPDVDGDRFFGNSSYPYMQSVFDAAFQFNADGTPVMRAATEYERETLGYADQVPVYNSANIPTTPWRDYVTRTAITNNHQVSLSSGTEKSRLYMSIAYLDQQAALIDQDYRRYSVNINGETNATSWLKASIGINGSNSIQNYGIVDNGSNTVAKDSYGLAGDLAPYAPAYDSEGALLRVSNGPSQHNILLNIEEAFNENRNYSIMLSSYIEATILPWLKWRTNFGSQYRNTRNGSYYGNNFTNPVQSPASRPNTSYNQHSERMSWTLENLIYINKTFKEIHKLDVTLLQSSEDYSSESLNVRAYENKFPTALWYSVGNSDVAQGSFGSGFDEQKRASYMARVNYSLKNRYLLTATGRWDGASMLAKDNKWDFFPSAAFAWKINQEDFLRQADWISEMKFRVGYGVTGNASINSYQTGGTMSSSYANIPFGQGNVATNTVGAKAVILPNKNLGWEKTASTNYGLDFGFLNNRVNGSLEYYIAKTSDLLMNRSIPIMTGYTSILSNIGKTQNNGIELTLSTVNVNTKNFKWRTDFTFYTNKEKIVELSNGQEDDPANGWFIGKPIDEVWTKKYDRLWQNTPEDTKLLALYKANGITMLPGQAKLVDQPLVEVAEGTEGSVTKTINIDGQNVDVIYLDNGFGKIDNDDNKFLGSFRPKWEGGFTTTFTYKNWELNSFIYGHFGGLYYGLLQTYGSRRETNIWSKDNPNGKYPQPLSGGQAFTNYSSFMNYTKSDIIVVRNIALSYTLPEKALKRVKMASAAVYVQVLNPFIFGGELVKAGINPDDVTGWRANSGSNGDYRYIGGQTNNTIITRSWVMGLRVGF